jgi:hypothetical protein
VQEAVVLATELKVGLVHLATELLEIFEVFKSIQLNVREGPTSLTVGVKANIAVQALTSYQPVL